MSVQTTDRTAENGVFADLTTAMTNAQFTFCLYHARQCAATTLAPTGKPDCKAFDAQQHMAHGFAWTTTYVETLRQVSEWAIKLSSEDAFGQVEQAFSQILFGEYCAQLRGGIPMTQTEIIRPSKLDLGAEAMAVLDHPPLRDTSQSRHSRSSSARRAGACHGREYRP